ncbi:hypothetical protein MTR67_044399 [Solanum verrucosum]|uniref:Uncharacterized protein n=1 Tax=Solanum verrucosum TaxID=315347 RepID=A0AAF0UTF0_SOLVR|nr:hypothetical protein MTR67_044399 [Solanum verrucosum]
MVMREIEPSLLQLLHQIELDLDELLQGQAEKETVFMLSLVNESKRIRQMLSLATVRVQGCLKTRPSHSQPRPRESSQPVVATISRGATRGWHGSEPYKGAKPRHHFTTRGHDHGLWKGSWGCLSLMGVSG